MTSRPVPFENLADIYVYLVKIRPNAYHAGEPLLIIGVRAQGLDGCSEPHYELETQGGGPDNMRIADTRDYKLITQRQLLAGEIPKVKRSWWS